MRCPQTGPRGLNCPRPTEAPSVKRGRSNQSGYAGSFPGWGAASLPAGIVIGIIVGGGLGAFFGFPGIGAAIGGAIGVSAGMVLLAAAIVTASTRSKN